MDMENVNNGSINDSRKLELVCEHSTMFKQRQQTMKMEETDSRISIGVVPYCFGFFSSPIHFIVSSSRLILPHPQKT